jgi:sugar phosphate isomerase/epimerase
LISALKELAPLAAEQGVVLALEPMHPACAEGCTFVTSLADAMAIIDQIESPQVRLSFDTYHYGIDPSVMGQLPGLAPRIAIVHLADGHPPDEEQRRTPLGRGCVPLRDLVSALREGGYDGDFDVELFGDEISPGDYETLLRESKSAFDRLCQ